MNALTKQQLEVAKAVIGAIESAEEYKIWAYYNERSDPSKFRSYESVFDNNLIVLSELFDLFLIDYEKAYYVIDNPRPDLWLFFTYGDTYDWEISCEVYYDFFKWLGKQIGVVNEI